VAVMEEGRDVGVWQKRALYYYSTAYLIDQFAYGRNQFGTVIDVLLYLLCFMASCLSALLPTWCCRLVPSLHRYPLSHLLACDTNHHI
jgi:hypothetical protein